MVPQWLIEKKRDGQALAADEIRSFVDGYTAGALPDYQMAALAMAIFFRGMSPAETSALTRSMLESGELIDLSALPIPRIDKHSTGGIGDKVSLVLAPLVACCGVAVPMVAGRGLGITGGTIDKLESIPGYRTDLSIPEFAAIVGACGCSIMGQTPRLCPADRKLYGLRDVTGTVPSIPLITASIMCKKLAESLNGLVLDVKCGSGAFMAGRGQAESLARSLMAVGKEMNLPVSAWLTAMDQPLGRSAGNRPEVAEAVRALTGKGPADLMQVTLALAARMLVLARKVRTDAEAMPLLESRIRSGAAMDRFREMVRLHGGDTDFLDDPGEIESRASATATLPSPTDGWVERVDADGIGRAVLLLGAGRSKAGEAVDPDAGVLALPKVGEHVRQGQPLARLHSGSNARMAEARAAVQGAIQLSPVPVPESPVLLADLGVNS